MKTDRPQSIYRSGGGDARRLFGNNARQADRYYSGYLGFISHHVPRGATLLDLGCGSGWSSWLLSRRHYNVTGLDVDRRAFEPPPGKRLRFAAASVLRLPFPDNSFDAVASYQMLEHVENPRSALNEMIRITKPGGVIIVAGPNLLSPLNSLRQIAFGCWRNRPLHSILIRQPQDPRLPFGHTLPEALRALALNTGRLTTKALFGGGDFLTREPDLRPPSRGDRDACVLLNPIDVAAYLRQQQCHILATAPPHRPSWTAPLAGGTWITARTPVPHRS